MVGYKEEVGHGFTHTTPFYGSWPHSMGGREPSEMFSKVLLS